MIVLHIGMPKTGTSALQHCLAAYAREHPDGVCYPVAGRDSLVAHHLLSRAVVAGDLSDEVMGPVLSELRNLRGRDAVISSEGFVKAADGDIFRLFDMLSRVGPVKIVLAVREMASFLESMYLQSSRTGVYQDTFPAYVASRQKWIGNFIGKLKRWRDCLGDAFEITFVGPGFNSVAMIERLAGFGDNALVSYLAHAPGNPRRSLKQQVAFLHLGAVSELIGHEIMRRRLIRAFDAGLAFDTDDSRYTLLDGLLTEQIRAAAAGACERYGFPEYQAFFQPLYREPKGTAASLDLAVLTPGDLEMIRNAVVRQRRPRRERPRAPALA
jgi:hypothetical protein